MKNKNKCNKLTGIIQALHLLAGTDIGGSEMLALNIARYSGNGSVNFHFVAGKAGLLAEEFKSSGKPFRIIPRRALIDPLFIYRLLKYCRKNTISVIHCHTLLECLNAFIVSGILGCKIFLTYHGYYYFSKNLPVKWVGLFLAGRVTANIFVSKTLHDYYSGAYNLKGVRTEVIHNGIHPGTVIDCDSAILRKEAGAGDSDIILGMTGNFAAARNHMMVCRAFSRLVNEHPRGKNLKLILIGKKDKEPSPVFSEVSGFCSRQGIMQQVYFAGPRLNAGMLVRNFDIFVYSTHRETFCLSVVEAITAGVPVIVNDLPVMKEITQSGRLATLYKSGDEDDLFRVLCDSVDNIEALKKKAANNSRIACEYFSIEKHLSGLEELYRKG